MFDEMPDVDKVFKLCLDIYMVRETKDFELEEDLFAKLMFLYRSPETLIKWTKYKRDWLSVREYEGFDESSRLIGQFSFSI